MNIVVNPEVKKFKEAIVVAGFGGGLAAMEAIVYEEEFQEILDGDGEITYEDNYNGTTYTFVIDFTLNEDDTYEVFSLEGTNHKTTETLESITGKWVME